MVFSEVERIKTRSAYSITLIEAERSLVLPGDRIVVDSYWWPQAAAPVDYHWRPLTALLSCILPSQAYAGHRHSSDQWLRHISHTRTGTETTNLFT